MFDTSQPRIDSKANLLIADAQAKPRAALAGKLRDKGYHVTETGSGQEALACLERDAYNVLLVEMELQGIPGVQLMRRARQMRPDLLIVVVTAHATVESTIAAIKVNVVDYLIKPSDPNDVELIIARALEERAQQVRRQNLLDKVREAMDVLQQPELATAPAVPPSQPVLAAQTGFMESGVLMLDREKRMVTIRTDPPRTVELTEGEVSILVTLMEKPNQVFTYSHLAKTALGYEGMDKWTVESVIRSTIFRLRHKLEDDSQGPQLIRTVRGRGYFFSLA